MNEVSLFRLYLLRALYLLVVVGLSISAGQQMALKQTGELLFCG